MEAMETCVCCGSPVGAPVSGEAEHQTTYGGVWFLPTPQSQIVHTEKNVIQWITRRSLDKDDDVIYVYLQCNAYKVVTKILNRNYGPLISNTRT